MRQAATRFVAVGREAGEERGEVERRRAGRLWHRCRPPPSSGRSAGGGGHRSGLEWRRWAMRRSAFGVAWESEGGWILFQKYLEAFGFLLELLQLVKMCTTQMLHRSSAVTTPAADSRAQLSCTGKFRNFFVKDTNKFSAVCSTYIEKTGHAW